jgi:hypothetical protein
MVILCMVYRYRTTGTFYGANEKRLRNIYPLLKEGREIGEVNVDRLPCEKAFMSKSKLTGGVMCIWCRHRICVGFHIIESGESRNDVFSPIYTRWTKAPRTIVYDFACQLGVYNMVREPNFFKETLHVIDHCHQSNHRYCSMACRLSEYKRSGFRDFVYINDSAAECGNFGLSKMKTSAMYMRKDHFMDLCKLQLEVQNRIRTIKLLRVINGKKGPVTKRKTNT